MIEHRLTRPRTPQSNGMERRVWALQWPHCGHPEDPSFHERRRPRTNLATLLPALQRTPAPGRHEQQNPYGRHEHVVRFPLSTLPTFDRIESSGMRHNRLAWMVADDPAASQEDLLNVLATARAALDFSPIENADVICRITRPSPNCCCA
jgi:hypothetical protein